MKCSFRIVTLKIPLDFSFEGYPPVFDDWSDVPPGVGQPFFEFCYRVPRNLGIRSLVGARQLYFEIVCEADDTRHPLCSSLRN
jgi:hypothetical protein